MRLKENTLAPDFEFTDLEGGKHSLLEFRGRKVLISFFRYSACPLCNLRVHQMIQKYKSWHQRNLEIIAIFASSEENMRQYVGTQNPPFYLFGDENRKIYKLYGVEKSLLGLFLGMFSLKKFCAAFRQGFFIGKMDTDLRSMPADFLIDEDGIIKQSFYSNDIGEHIDFDRIEKFLVS
jgi:peroxiredoxin